MSSFDNEASFAEATAELRSWQIRAENAEAKALRDIHKLAKIKVCKMIIFRD